MSIRRQVILEESMSKTAAIDTSVLTFDRLRLWPGRRRSTATVQTGTGWCLPAPAFARLPAGAVTLIRWPVA